MSENATNENTTITPAPTEKGTGMGTGMEFEKTREAVKLPPVIVEQIDEIKKQLRDGVTLMDIAAKYGFERHTIARYVHNTPELETAYQDGIDQITDAYEKRLHDLAFAEQEMVVNAEGESVPTKDGRVMAVNLNAVKFYLERRAANRGYGAKLETNEVGNGRGGVVPIIIMGDMSEDKIIEAEAHVNAVNEDALEGLEGYGSMG